MKKLIAALLMCCSTVAYGQTTVQQPVTETTHQMTDDSYIQVTLPFDFTFYNRTFTESWMYDNGIISFVQPGQPNALSNFQWYAFPLEQTNSNYYIAALWADIAPVSITKYITQTDGTYMKYIWQDIAEYYSQGGNWRLNTFSTTLRNDGSIETNYTNINLQTSAITVGTVGNLNAGEYNQIYYAPCCNIVTTGMINNWSISGLPPIVTPPEPTPQQEIYVAPQYTEETVSEAVAVTTPTVVVEPEPTPVTTTQTSNTIVATIQAATEASPASITTASVVATTSASDSSSNKMSIADAQAIAKTNQKNTDQLVSSIVAGSIENSISQTSTTDTETIATAENTLSAIDSTQSSSINSISNQANSGSTENNVSSSSSSSAIGLANFARLPGATNVEETTSITENSTFGSVESTDTLGSDNSTTNLTVESYAIVTDETNPTSVRNLAAMSSLKQLELEEENEKRDIEIADMSVGTTVSELAGTGVELAQLQVLPIGYNIYLSTTLKDLPFYLPKVIYRNQTVVDNAPAQRLLKFASDAKFDQMVSQQYGEQK